MVCTPEPAGTWQTLPESSTSPRGPLMLMLSQRLTTDMATPGPTMVHTATTARGLLMPRLTLPTKWLPVTMWPMPTPLDTPTTWESSPECLTATTASPPTLDMDTLTLVNFLLTK